MSLNGKTAIITGGLGGIGLATAKCLLQNGVSNLVLLDIAKSDDELASLRNNFKCSKIVYLSTDVTDIVSVERAFQTISEQIGGFDILLNVAGILNETKPELCVKVNVLGVINMCQAAVNFIVNQNSPSDRIIVNVSSVAGMEVKPYVPVYRATKHAVVAYTRTMAACDYSGKYGLRFVIICPGRTLTPMLDCLNADLEANGKSSAQPIQSAEECANCILQMIESAENGAIWLFRDSKIEKVLFSSASHEQRN